MNDRERIRRIVKAWEALFHDGYPDNDANIGHVSEQIGLEGYCLFRLRDAIRGNKTPGYSDIDDGYQATLGAFKKIDESGGCSACTLYWKRRGLCTHNQWVDPGRPLDAGDYVPPWCPGIVQRPMREEE